MQGGWSLLTDAGARTRVRAGRRAGGGGPLLTCALSDSVSYVLCTHTHVEYGFL